METLRHKFQMDLLIDTLDAWLEARGDGFAGGNMFLYYSLEQVRRQAFIGPDFFVALDVPRGERKSWVIWEQGKGPDVVVELLSASTAQYDKTAKKTLYARQVHVPEYYWYDPHLRPGFRGFCHQWRRLPATGRR
ncbi:MAG: Uma2 family endonuclease [Comamonadaceae bacterium]|nr:Uma2 family endonuclease [Comamonadaceae bacterium]